MLIEKGRKILVQYQNLDLIILESFPDFPANCQHELFWKYCRQQLYKFQSFQSNRNEIFYGANNPTE